MFDKIDFLIIGTPKGGTTALASFLRQHKDIYLPEQDLPGLITLDFDGDLEGQLSPCYSDDMAERCVGGVDVTTLFFTGLAERIHDCNESLKLVTVLRNPIDRAYSSFWYARRFGWEDAETFEDALDLEEARGKGTVHQQALSVLEHGCYARSLEVYFGVFGREQVRVILNEGLRSDAEETVSGCLEWLGVSGDISGVDVRKTVNEGGVARSDVMRKVMMSHESKLRRVIRRMTSRRLREKIFDAINKPLIMMNCKKGEKYPPMAEATRSRLVEFYRPWNQKLSELLGSDFSHWDK